MVPSWKDMAAGGLILALAVAASAAWSGLGPSPSADVARGTEDAFGRGLHRRELPPGGAPQRWTTERASFTFHGLAGAPLAVTVQIRDARGPVAIVSDGVVLGRVGPGPGTTTVELPRTGRATREVELWAEPFRAGDGRVLGARLGRVELDRARSAAPAVPIVLLVLVPAMGVLLAARTAGLGPWAAAAVAAATIAFETAALWPSGLSHSPYARRLAILLLAGSLAALAFARLVGKHEVVTRRAAFVALLAAWLVQVAAATSPVMVVSDAVFHANKLAAVAEGDLFPTSVTQHARPFRFPYGVSFYALLAPLARAGLDTVDLVRGGAALAGLAATAAVFLLGLSCGGPRLGALAALLLQLVPGAFDVAYSYGNLSHAFGQAAMVLFFCWWAGRATGGWPAGALLLALAMLAHFSTFVFALALAAALAVAEARGAEGARTRLVAAGAGILAASAYYAHFGGLVWDQLPRLFEGGGQGRGASRSAWDAARLQASGALAQWGAPLIALAIVGRPRPEEGSRGQRALAAYWVAGLALALPAVFSPFEVRYLYGLTAALALSGAAGALRLDAAGGARRALGVALLVAQAVFAAGGIAHAIVGRYRS
ncbi:MAG TPA: hypothetical protein VMR21_08455 [Vicinamibacteria bacterium]|nr:hypothetical protein [Vicinamibacteria bacterium]